MSPPRLLAAAGSVLLGTVCQLFMRLSEWKISPGSSAARRARSCGRRPAEHSAPGRLQAAAGSWLAGYAAALGRARPHSALAGARWPLCLLSGWGAGRALVVSGCAGRSQAARQLVRLLGDADARTHDHS